MNCTTCPTDIPDCAERHSCKALAAEVRHAADIQVRRLDVENGDILVLRTAQKLSEEKTDEWHDMLLDLARRHGVRHVTVVLLDNCTDLTIERPGPLSPRTE